MDANWPCVKRAGIGVVLGSVIGATFGISDSMRYASVSSTYMPTNAKLRAASTNVLRTGIAFAGCFGYFQGVKCALGHYRGQRDYLNNAGAAAALVPLLVVPQLRRHMVGLAITVAVDYYYDWKEAA